MENIEEFLTKKISEINDNTNLEELSKEIVNTLVSTYGYVLDSNLEMIIYNLLIEYKNKRIDIQAFLEMIKSYLPIDAIGDYPSSGSSGSGGGGSSSSGSSESSGTAVIDVETEFINEVSSTYSLIEEKIKGITLNVSNADVAAEAKSLIDLIKSKNETIQSYLSEIKGIMVEALESIEFVDEQVQTPDIANYGFDELKKYSGNLIASGVKVADESFYESCGCSVNNGLVTIGEYTYNIKNRMLNVNGVRTPMTVYVPTGVSDYSKVNTVTLFDGVNPKSVTSNSILISLDENDSLKTPNVANATKFINKVAKTDLAKCQNIITGGSHFGARSLKIAADSGDLYQTVICVNNALLVKGYNSAGKGKEALDSIEQLKKLNGKNIYFVSSKNDNHFNMRYGNGSEYYNDNDVTKSYLYTGIQLAIQNCPNSKIFFVSNNDNPAFSEISAPNYYYGFDLWSEFASSNDYKEHSKYHDIIADMLGKNVICYNEYTDKTTS